MVQSNSVLDLNAVLMFATEESRGDLCTLAKEWIDDRHGGDYLNDMLVTAARNGNYDLCILAKEWIDAHGGTVDLYRMYCVAVDNCEDLAHRWMEERECTEESKR